MNLELDWPVGRAGVAVVSPSEVETAFLGEVTGGDQFEVASVTKLMTSLAALAAVSSGRIELDQPVPEAGEGVTVRHLLAHAAGFPFEPPGRQRPPAQRRIYSNVGFRVLAEAVADAAGTTFATWLSTSVLDPLEMSATRLVHRRGIDGDPAAGAASTLDDLVRLARCLLERGAPVIGPDLFAEATERPVPRPGRPRARGRPLRPLRLGARLRAPRRQAPPLDGRPPLAVGLRPFRGQRLLPLGRPRRRPGRRRRHRPPLRRRQVGHGHLARLVRPPAGGHRLTRVARVVW